MRVRVQALVRDPEHPVRRFSPMDEPTFALVASETIKAEEPFAIYTGTLWEEPQLLVRARGPYTAPSPAADSQLYCGAGEDAFVRASAAVRV